jgi:choline transport protein
MDSKNIITDSTTQIMTDPEVGSKTSSNYDELQLQAQGHKQEMPRARFGLLSLFAIAFTMTSSWVGFSTSIGIGLLYGNTAAIIYGQIVAASACMMITLGLAELASAYPSSGGRTFVKCF